MCCCISKSKSTNEAAESHTIENHATKGQSPLLDKARELDKVLYTFSIYHFEIFEKF